MKNGRLLHTIILACIIFSFSGVCSAAGTNKKGERVEEEIWALEEAYFTGLYRADYEGVLAIVHDRFLGWPGAAVQPIDKEESARFMRQLIPKPTSCTVVIERTGFRLQEGVALTHYLLHLNCSNTTGPAKTESSRITHTWVKEGTSWKLLGGMSYDR